MQCPKCGTVGFHSEFALKQHQKTQTCTLLQNSWERKRLTDRIVVLERFAAFARSAILSGESWTQAAQEMYDVALPDTEEMAK
jgi:hypothetical protein